MIKITKINKDKLVDLSIVIQRFVFEWEDGLGKSAYKSAGRILEN